jgi:hypothetical protein
MADLETLPVAVCQPPAVCKVWASPYSGCCGHIGGKAVEVPEHPLASPRLGTRD